MNLVKRLLLLPHPPPTFDTSRPAISLWKWNLPDVLSLTTPDMWKWNLDRVLFLRVWLEKSILTVTVLYKYYLLSTSCVLWVCIQDSHWTPGSRHLPYKIRLMPAPGPVFFSPRCLTWRKSMDAPPFIKIQVYKKHFSHLFHVSCTSGLLFILTGLWHSKGRQ